MRLRSHLAVLALAGVVPLLALTAIVAASLVEQQRVVVDRGLCSGASPRRAAGDGRPAASPA